MLAPFVSACLAMLYLASQSPRRSQLLGQIGVSFTVLAPPEGAEALEALERVGLRERARHLPSQLSGGEQQRVCVARALINHPELILADEPTGNLDEANENIVLDLFRQLHREGTTLIVVTHDPEVAEAAQRTIVLEHGKVAREIINENFGKS